MTGMQPPLDDFWDDLLECIEERRVVPIIGPDLLTVTVEGRETLLYPHLATRLAERLRIPASGLPAEPSLHEVVCQYLQARGRREEVYPKIRSLMKEVTVAPPAPLVKLARIKEFDLFVTLTFDALMVDALNQARFGGATGAEHLAFAPNKVQDLPAERERLPRPVVYALLGRLSASPDYVITEEDTLEFLYALQSEAKRPQLLFDELQHNHLLIVGCAFPDWLARFFIRIAKSRQLSMQRGETEILVAPHVADDRNLVVFLEHFSYGTRLLPCNAVEFVAELARRWEARHPQAPQPKAADAAAAGEPLADMAPGAIFLSYAKEDFEAVERLKTSLELAGLDVWFDKHRLEAGDQYDQKIRRNIKNCSLFVPVISGNTERRLEGYFRREWKLAEERALGIAEHVPFIVPVVVDDTDAYTEGVPERLQKAQWTRLPNGVITPEFEARMVRLVRECRKRERGHA
ncbi:MAG: toll/interleukin-1 receptor domain-containing protein [Betaproteobacteria bacterium]|nr:toll/interleukin-1 receptor domain-containing protein [Betaproteobacteria bacterium]